MSLRLSSGLVAASLLENKTCPVLFNGYAVIVVPINFRECNVNKPYGKLKEVDLYLPQGADRIFQFDDLSDDINYGSASAITFDVWDSITAASTNRITKSIGSGIDTPSDDKINVTITGTDSNITAQRYRYELWATTSTSDRYLLKAGDFYIEDTRKYD